MKHPIYTKEYIRANLFSNNKFNGMLFGASPQDLKDYLKTIHEKHTIAVYLILNDLEQEPLCEICGEKPKYFISINKGYGKYCSCKCTSSRDKSNDKVTIKDYSTLDQIKFYQLYDVPKILELLNYTIRSDGNTNPNISVKDIGLKDPNLYMSILHYTKFLDKDALLKERLYCLRHNVTKRPLCEVCGTPVAFYTLARGYKRFCGNPKCYSNVKDVLDKRIKTKIDNNPNWKEEWVAKSAETHKKKTGYRHNMLDPACKEKIKQSNLSKYGVESPMQVAEIYNKQQRRGYTYKDYTLPSGKVIRIQGYEWIYLDEYFSEGGLEEDLVYDNKLKPEIWYSFEGKNKRYYCDFYIKSKNLVIEVKSDYTLDKEIEKNKAKFEATRSSLYDIEVVVYDRNKDRVVIYV